MMNLNMINLNKKSTLLLGLLALFTSMLFVSSVSAENTYQVENWKRSDDGTTWYYNITYTKTNSTVKDISHLRLDFLCVEKPDNKLSVYISSAGGDCLNQTETECGTDVFPCNTTYIKWEFNSTCLETQGTERQITVWFSTYPYVYDAGPLRSVEAKGGDEVDNEYQDLEAPWCGSFFEVPELPLGTLSAVAAPLIAYGLLKAKKKEG